MPRSTMQDLLSPQSMKLSELYLIRQFVDIDIQDSYADIDIHTDSNLLIQRKILSYFKLK